MLQQFYPSPLDHGYAYELHKDMNFSSAHYIPNEKAGPCQRLHGHTYFVDITVAGNELDELGFLTNFKGLKDQVHGRFDHRTLNNHMEEIPSTELLAREIWVTIQTYLNQFPNKPKCLQVIVRETPTSYVIFRPIPLQFQELIYNG